MFQITFGSPKFGDPIITKDGVPIDRSQLNDAEKDEVINLLLEKLKEVNDQALEDTLGEDL